MELIILYKDDSSYWETWSIYNKKNYPTMDDINFQLMVLEQLKIIESKGFEAKIGKIQFLTPNEIQETVDNMGQ